MNNTTSSPFLYIPLPCVTPVHIQPHLPSSSLWIFWIWLLWNWSCFLSSLPWAFHLCLLVPALPCAKNLEKSGLCLCQTIGLCRLDPADFNALASVLAEQGEQGCWSLCWEESWSCNPYPRWRREQSWPFHGQEGGWWEPDQLILSVISFHVIMFNVHCAV